MVQTNIAQYLYPEAELFYLYLLAYQSASCVTETEQQRAATVHHVELPQRHMFLRDNRKASPHGARWDAESSRKTIRNA